MVELAQVLEKTFSQGLLLIIETLNIQNNC